MPAQTLAQKIIARAAGVPQVAVGDIVTCKVDLAMFHDSSGPRRLKPMLAELGATIWDKSKVVLVLDHYLPERDEESRQIIRIARDWARDERLPHVYDGQGICHVVTPQRGHIRPGMLCVGGDSHSPTGGAFGAYMFGVGSTEMLGVVVTGEIWLKVPDTLRFCWSGTLQPGVTAKDMMLRLIGQFGTNGGQYQAVEFAGEAVRALNMQERMTLCNMTAELGAQTGLVAPDDVTDAALREAGVAPENYAHLHTDQGAALQHFDFNAATLTPYVAAPHSPANAHPVGVFKGQAIQVAYVGACTGAKLTDLEAAASVLKNRRVAAGVTLLVAPASRQDQRAAEESGALHALMAAGATLLPTACGACAGYGGSVGEGNTVISTTARNFKGRMGAATAEVFLASPYTVAASAVAGQIVDPREVMA
jgi:3-isopropylmalate/(R)-2-methylmalate dehydratase large subunit